MDIVKVAIAGFGGVGRATADLLLARRNRYRQVYGIDLRLVAVCGLRSGLSDAGGLEPERLDALEEGLSGPEFIEASGAEILIEAGPSDSAPAGRASPTFVPPSRPGATPSSYRRARWSTADQNRALSRVPRGDAETRWRGRSRIAHDRPSRPQPERLQSARNRGHFQRYHQRPARCADEPGARLRRGAGARAGRQVGGYAEADPHNDTEGWNTASKLLILANFGLDADLTMDDLAVEGIQSIREQRIVRWREERLVPKLIGSLSPVDGATRAAVGVWTYPLTDPLAHVSGKNKAICITTDAMGETIAIGSGTEPLATAAAALKDLEHILTARVARSASLPGASS